MVFLYLTVTCTVFLSKLSGFVLYLSTQYSELRKCCLTISTQYSVLREWYYFSMEYSVLEVVFLPIFSLCSTQGVFQLTVIT